MLRMGLRGGKWGGRLGEMKWLESMLVEKLDCDVSR